MTGATGYLGSRVLHELLHTYQDLSIVVLKRSFSDTRRITHLLPYVHTIDADACNLSDIFHAHKFTAIFHFATNYGRGQKESYEIIEANLLLPLRLLELGLQHGVKVFLNTDTMLDKNISDYTLSKKQFQEWLKKGSERILTINVALEHFYGPGDDPTKFVSNIVYKLLNKTECIPLTSGTQKRDFIYVDDVVSAFLCIIANTNKHNTGYMPFEVGTGQTISIRDFVTLTKELCGNTTTELKFGAVPLRANEPADVRVDTTKLAALGWQPQISLTQGILQTIAKETERL